MGKYNFIQLGAQVKWDMFNDGNFELMQVCTEPQKPILHNTKISLIPIQEIDMDMCSSDSALASELRPHLTDFDKGYWCAIQDAVANGTAYSTIERMLHCAGFSYWECQFHMEESDFQAEILKTIVQDCFCQTPDYIDWNGADYPTKTVTIFKGTSAEEEIIVSVVRLARQLLDDIGNWSTREAEDVDNQIYFYLDEETFNLPDEDIIEYLENER